MRQMGDRLQVPLLFAFRAAAEAGDARKVERTVTADGSAVVSARHTARRRMTDEDLLRRDLAVDLMALMNTIDLGSCLNLDGLEHAAASVLNYGIYDVASLTSDDERLDHVATNLAASLIQHEPRLIPDSVRVTRGTTDDEVGQRVRFSVAAEMICKPVDIPIEFTAEVDMGSGKVELSRF